LRNKYPHTTHIQCGEEFHLLPEKALVWPKEELLVIADVHAGKSAHFRRNGIPVPSAVFDKDLQRLSSLIQIVQPRKVLFLGDLFHSKENKEMQVLKVWMESYPVEFLLVAGNHDRHTIKLLKGLPMQIFDENLILGPFDFSHDKLEQSEGYNISGHLHPSVILKGKARQSVRVECFVFGKKNAIIPAFGTFTGTMVYETEKTDRVFAVTAGEVIGLF
jgi:uncharacterized protein